jgi:hypothetical protein
MDDTTISAIIEAAKAQPPELQGRWIAEQAIAAARAADARISDQDLEAEYRAWYERESGRAPPATGKSMAVWWGRHCLSGVRHG